LGYSDGVYQDSRGTSSILLQKNDKTQKVLDN
jgi:hypothetical protein